MKNDALSFFFLTLGFITSTSAQDAADEITWLSDYDIARTYAHETGRPLLVSFRCVP